MPRAGNSFEIAFAPRLKGDARARDQILRCARNQNFAGRALTLHARSNMHRDSTDVVAHHLDFTSMDTRANVEPQLFDLGSDSRGAADRPGWAVEKSAHDTVAGGICFAAAIVSELRPDESVVIVAFPSKPGRQVRSAFWWN